MTNENIDQMYEFMYGLLNMYKNHIISADDIEFHYITSRPFLKMESERYKNFQEILDKLVPSICPPIGTGFVGYKILKAKMISGKFISVEDAPVTYDTAYIPAMAELYIPEDAKRSSAFGKKCRCNHCIVKRISVVNSGKIQDILSASSPFIDERYAINYVINDDVFVDDFDDERWNECSTGIHFFTNIDDALEYAVELGMVNAFNIKDICEFDEWFRKNKYSN